MHPQLEFVDQLIRMLGWPTLLGMVIWVIRKWDAAQRDAQEIGTNTKLAVQKVSFVETELAAIKTNHLAHLQEGITRLAGSNDEAVVVLHDIKAGIGILVDRTPRA